LPYIYKTRKKPVQILIPATLPYLIPFLLIYVPSINFFNIDIINQIQTLFTQTILQTQNILTPIPIPITNQQKHLLTQINHILQSLFPTILLLLSVSFSSITVIISATLLKK
ncbi:DUF2232 domain-containing protein, partial [Bacillus thuringiensis]|uniref:DUF2232 domain-containing protein n=1 Tax=Bacillus thuringiensis TaxID=1428 RepID=UPI00119E2188